MIVLQAKDLDSPTSKNGTFDFRIVSVTPKPSDMEFFIQQNMNYGNISFRGCLDYEVREVLCVILSVSFLQEKNI